MVNVISSPYWGMWGNCNEWSQPAHKLTLFYLSISFLHIKNPLLTHIKSLSGETALNTVQVFVFFGVLTDFVPDISDDVFG